MAEGVMMKTELTPHQSRVLLHLAAGKQRHEVAAALGVTENTIKSHVTNAFNRLGASNAAHAVALAFRAGVLQ
jgi:DNA-binding NarL/FixJ family response regulator